MPTYRRFTCVERSIACFLAQETELETELIICNTDIEHPLELDDTFSEADKSRIKIYNSNVDTATGRTYVSTGEIRRDGVRHSTGQLYITWDDDDIFLPWNTQQCYDGLVRTGLKGWKPKKSIAWWQEEPLVQYNVLEATVLMYIEEATFDANSGPEGMNWYNRLIMSGQLAEDEYSIPGYCYYWRDPVEIGGHKQGNSEDINKINNFEMHMSRCIDRAQRKLTKRGLDDYSSIVDSLKPIFDDIQNVKPELYDRYVKNFFKG
jgi:hypothetical protein